MKIFLKILIHPLEIRKIGNNRLIDFSNSLFFIETIELDSDSIQWYQPNGLLNPMSY